MDFSSFRRHVGASLMAGLCALILAPTVAAQESWPTRPIKLIVPNPPGGAVDIFARAIAERLSAALGQPVVVDNKSGAAGLLATKAVAQAAPDGYTLGYIHAGLITVQLTSGRLDLLKELRPVAKLSSTPFALVVRTDSSYATVKDLIAAVRARPGALSYGSAGIASPAHFAVEYFQEKVGNFQALHVPFKGASETAQAMLGGQVEFQIGNVGAITPLVQTGKLRALAVTSRARLAVLPNAPTMAEAGVSDFVFEPWGGLAAPAGTPESVIKRLNDVLPGIMNSPQIKEVTNRMGGQIDFSDSKALSAQIAREIEAERPIVKRLGLAEK